jgi:hypothetical protein
MQMPSRRTGITASGFRPIYSSSMPCMHPAVHTFPAASDATLAAAGVGARQQQACDKASPTTHHPKACRRHRPAHGPCRALARALHHVPAPAHLQTAAACDGHAHWLSPLALLPHPRRPRHPNPRHPLLLLRPLLRRGGHAVMRVLLAGSPPRDASWWCCQGWWEGGLGRGHAACLSLHCHTGCGRRGGLAPAAFGRPHCPCHPEGDTWKSDRRSVRVWRSLLKGTPGA